MRIRLWVEIPGNCRRALKELKKIIDNCPGLRSLALDITTERNLAISQAVLKKVLAKKALWIRRRRRNIDLATSASVVDDPDE